VALDTLSAISCGSDMPEPGEPLRVPSD
jgi:hypothetical protein